MLKVTNFHTVILNDCKFTPETLSEFLNMLEYYDSTCHLEVEMIFEDEDLWKTFCLACTNIMSLESLTFKKMDINETYMRSLLSAVRNNSNITILKFDSCILMKLPSFYLGLYYLYLIVNYITRSYNVVFLLAGKTYRAESNHFSIFDKFFYNYYIFRK